MSFRTEDRGYSMIVGSRDGKRRGRWTKRRNAEVKVWLRQTYLCAAAYYSCRWCVQCGVGNCPQIRNCGAVKPETACNRIPAGPRPRNKVTKKLHARQISSNARRSLLECQIAMIGQGFLRIR